MLPLHCARSEDGFVTAVEASILTGGCTSSRASLAGACHGALGTDAAIPKDWLDALADGKEVVELANKLVAHRPEASAL